MRISDWSSDVCSSDLAVAAQEAGVDHPAACHCVDLAATGGLDQHAVAIAVDHAAGRPRQVAADVRAGTADFDWRRWLAAGVLAGERKSVVSGKNVSVRVDPGGRRIMKKKKQLE